MSFSNKWKVLAAGTVMTLVLAEPAMANAADPLAQAADFFKQAVTVVLGVISALIFAVAAYGVVTKLAAAAGGKGDWGAVALPFIVGAIAAMFVGYLYTQGITAAAQIQATSIESLTLQVMNFA